MRNFWRRMLLVLACVFLLLAGMQIQEATASKDYIEVPGYIDDISSRVVLTHRGFRHKYTYTVHWTYEGDEYSKRIKTFSPPEENLSHVRISEDNTDLSTGTLEDQHYGSLICFIISATAFFGWIALYKKDKNKTMTRDEWDSVYINSWIAIVVLAIGTFFCYVGLNSANGALDAITMKGLVTGFAVADIIAVVINRMAKKRK